MSERESKQRRMHVAVVRIGGLDVFPPAINLVDSLVRQGHSVSLLANDVSKAGKLPFLGSESVELVDLGTHEGNVLQREVDNLRRRKIIRSYLGTHKSDIDVVWTVTDIAARETGRILFDFRHVMQLSELVEYVPALGMGSDIPLRSNLTIELARRADRVVVRRGNNPRPRLDQGLPASPKSELILPCAAPSVKRRFRDGEGGMSETGAMPMRSAGSTCSLHSDVLRVNGSGNEVRGK